MDELPDYRPGDRLVYTESDMEVSVELLRNMSTLEREFYRLRIINDQGNPSTSSGRGLGNRFTCSRARGESSSWKLGRRLS